LDVCVRNWLTAEQGKRLLNAAGSDTLRSKRNGAILSLLIGCGLRRAELLNLTMSSSRSIGCPFATREVATSANAVIWSSRLSNDLLRAMHKPDTRWQTRLLENTHLGKVHFALEDGDGRPNRWNTLRLMRVLSW
jgi:hypothetical protein